MEAIINTDEIKRRVNVFIRYCDYIKDDCEEDFEEELLDFVMDITEDFLVKETSLEKKLKRALNEVQNLRDASKG